MEGVVKDKAKLAVAAVKGGETQVRGGDRLGGGPPSCARGTEAVSPSASAGPQDWVTKGQCLVWRAIGVGAGWAGPARCCDALPRC